MKKIFFLLATVCLVQAAAAQKPDPVRIGWITEGLSSPEQSAAGRYLELSADRVIFPVSLPDLSSAFLQKNRITEIFWLKDSGDITAAEKEAGPVLRQFAASGGHLVLSMEAVRLLHVWGIEKNPFDIEEDTVRDEGFGRPLGFHAYMSHPVFAGLHGGAYPWKGKTDHVVRKIGFFGSHLPDTSVAKVIGIGWSYITFHEDEKLVLEYSVGKGSALAVGAYTYFSRPNFNTAELYRFYDNLFNYAAGRIHGIKAGFWSYARPAVYRSQRKTGTMKIARATSWNIPVPTLRLSRARATPNFVNVTGRRMLLMGKETGGIEEIWTHPFMAFRDVQTAIQVKGEDTLVWLKKMTPLITVSPEMLIRKYVVGHDTLCEMITVAFDKPEGVLHYEWTGTDIARIWIKYTSNLREMWPYSDTCSPVMNYQWSDGLQAAVVCNPHAGSQSIMGFSTLPGKHLLGQFRDFRIDNGNIHGIPTSLGEVSGMFGFDAGSLGGRLNTYFVAGSGDLQGTLASYRNGMGNLNALYRTSAAYYKRLLNTQMMITTPSREFNEGYRWAVVRSDQFLQTTPGVGTSMMAGFGTTASGWNGRQKISGRPGYAWYFGRDGQWSSMALDALGGFDKVKEVLDMFVRYQAVNGKIFHELTSSGAVHYDASDATPLFVVLASHYLHYSGDRDYIRKIWPAIKKAMDFCYSTDTDNDGLIENTNVGHGWVEGGPLFGTHTEFYLAGSWAAALDGAAYITSHLGLAGLEKQYRADAEHVKKSIDTDFWSDAQKSFYNGKMKDGSYMKDATVLQAVPVLLGAVTDPQKAWLATDAFAADRFSTDWGMRIIADDNPKFNPFAYHSGMVWPLFSGYASLAEYKTGHYTAGYTHLMNNLLEYRTWALGSVGETLSGATYRPAGVCSLQGWSETMVIQPAIEGMLGFSPDALSSGLSLSPRFPWDWDTVDVTHMHIGKILVNMHMRRSPGKSVYHFEKEGNGTLLLNFSPVLEPGSVLRKVRVGGKEVVFTATEQPEGVVITLPRISLTDPVDVVLEYSPGAGVLPLIYEPEPGDSNSGAKITGQSWKKEGYFLKVQGIPGKTYQLKIRSAAVLKSIQNATVVARDVNGCLISFTIPEGTAKYGEQDIRIVY